MRCIHSVQAADTSTMIYLAGRVVSGTNSFAAQIINQSFLNHETSLLQDDNAIYQLPQTTKY